MNIAEIREKYPQYNDLSDEQLAQALHQKSYSYMDYAEFTEKIGLSATPETPADSMLDDALDVAGEFAAGANRTLMWIPDTLISAVNMIPGVEIPDSSSLPGIEGGFMDPGTARDATRAAGEVLGPGAMASVQVARNLAKPIQAAAEFMGFGSARVPMTAEVAEATQEAIGRVAGQPVAPIQDTLEPFSRRNSPRDLAVRRGRGDAPGAGYKLGPSGQAIPDPAQKKALSGGLSRPVVAQVSQASPADKQKIGQMLDVVEAGLENKTVGDFNLPRSVLGDSMYSRYQVVEEVNERAGRAVRRASDELRDVPLDGRQFLDGPVRKFLENLKQLDVTVNPEDGTLGFARSAFRGSPAAQKVLRKVMKDFKDTPFETYYDLHTFKLFIDDMVEEYGKSAKGLSGRTERIVKMLRHDVNDFIRDRSENYAVANDIFSESIDVLNEADRLVGRNNAADSRSLSRAARKAVSNYATGDQMQDLLVNMDDLAKKYGADFGDDLKTQVSVVQTIEKLFPSARPPASFAGDIDKVASWMSLATGDKVGVAAKAGQYVMKKFAKDEDARLAETVKLIRALLEDSAN